ncbi:MAG: hemin ABC transporter substrate-binding protein [Nocardioides sp.]|uniref:heme/hemin ABC transporter substrate-binding protein n=1 Tax=Nocardioides sp. TaxID=35761 RepID=UPI003F0BAFED
MRARQRSLGVLAATLLLSVLAACGGSEGDGGSGTDAVAAPRIDEVEVSSDPRAFSGVVNVDVDDPIDPVEAGEQALPVTLTDAQGTEVTVTDTSRVLALDLYGTLSRTVFELGMGDTLVGRDLSTQFDEATDLPLVTSAGGHDLNAESLLALEPTLIITDTSLGPWDVILQMRDAGVPVVVVDSGRNLDNVAEITQMVADSLGVPAAGTALGERTEGEIADVRAKIEAAAPGENERLRTVFLYVRGAANVYYMFGEGSGADDLISAVGAYDVASEIGWKGMRPVTAEGLIDASPELVVMMTKGLESTGGVDGLLEKVPALAQTPAGQNQRFVTIEDSLILGYGPATAEVLNGLSVAVLAPESLT